jgi:rhodanese-related sulfurtransferase
MQRYADLLADAAQRVREILPWDLAALLAARADALVVDVREPAEFAQARIAGSINVPRGVLEGACDWGYDDTVPDLVRARSRKVVVVCRSGNRSLLAADVMARMGYADVVSLRTGVRGWNDFEQPLVAGERDEPVDGDRAEALLASKVRPEQRGEAVS